MPRETKDPTKTHRHDVGVIAHGPVTAEHLTSGIQLLLGTGIAFTCALLAYTLIAAAAH